LLKTQVYEGVTQIMMGREVEGTVYYWTSAYLVEGLLVDSGCSYTAEELVGFSRRRRVDRLVNTHHHEDHVGGNALIKRELGVGGLAHAKAIPLIKSRLPLHSYQELVWGYPEPSQARPVPEIIETKSCCFQVLDTPGHSPDHLALFEPERGWCFCGDLFVSEDQKTLRADEDIFGIAASLRRLLELPGERLVLFTAIGRIFPEGRSAVRAYLDHLARLQARVQELKEKGFSPEAIRDEIFQRESRLAELTGGHFSILNLVRQLMDDTRQV